jgi:methyl-accepting chemotaxis protein
MGGTVTLNFNQLRIGGRIVTGFGLIIGLLVVIAGFGVFELSSVRASIARLSSASENLNRALEVGRDGEVMRQRSLRYKAVHDPDAITQFNEAHQHAIDTLAAAARVTLSDERRRLYVAGSQAADVAKRKFDEMANAVDQFLHAQKSLFSAGDELNAVAHRAIETAENTKETDTIMAARDLDIALNVMRVSNWRFQAIGDPAGIPLFRTNVQKANAAIDQFEKVANEAARSSLSALRAGVKSYGDNFADVSQSMLKADDLYEKQVRPALAELYKTTHAAEDSLRADMADTKGKADSNVTFAIVLALSVGLAAAVGGIGLAWYIGRGISRPLVALTEGMRELAGGNFEVVLPGLDRMDEIGEIATAVETFKVKSAEKVALEADEQLRRQKAEADAQAAAATERARAAEQQAKAQAEAQAAVDAERANAAAQQAKAATERARAAEQQAKAQAEAQAAVDAERANAAAQQAKAAEEQGQAIRSLAAGLGRLAKGDLTFRLNEGFTDAYKQIKDDFNAAIERLHEAIGAITQSTREVANAASEISSSTTDLSQRTEEQAANLEETSASMEQMSATVRKNAENAQKADQSAASTREVANRGGQVVAEAVDAMARIDEASRKISDIIGVIDEIARQTNLLALNAAVEAARAGEAGRGFAVVASEVRSLAQRSSQAAKDIKDLITNSNNQVKDGVELVNRAGAALNEIVESIKKVAGIVSDIAAASAEQAAGIEQVNKALTQMDEVTQQNSALVEENAATAKTLEQQAKAMSEQVSVFRLDASSPSHPASHSARAVPDAPKSIAATKQTAAQGNSANTSVKGSQPRRGGPVGRMQAALATAVSQHEWKDF